jgi:hypothetical protein
MFGTSGLRAKPLVVRLALGRAGRVAGSAGTRAQPSSRRSQACTRRSGSATWSPCDRSRFSGGVRPRATAPPPEAATTNLLVRALRGSSVSRRADPVGRTSAPSPKATEAQSRRGAKLAANDRDPRGRPPIRPLGLTPSSSRATPTRGSGGSSGNAAHGPPSAKPQGGATEAARDRRVGAWTLVETWRWAAITPPVARPRLGAAGGDARRASGASGGGARRASGRRVSPRGTGRRAGRRAAQADSAGTAGARHEPGRSQARAVMAGSPRIDYLPTEARYHRPCRTRMSGPRLATMPRGPGTRDGTPEPAEDDEQQRRRAQDARARPGLTAPSRSVAVRRPAHAGLLRAAGKLDPRPEPCPGLTRERSQ